MTFIEETFCRKINDLFFFGVRSNPVRTIHERVMNETSMSNRPLDRLHKLPYKTMHGLYIKLRIACLLAYLSACLHVCLFVYLSVYLSACLFASLPASLP